MEQLVDTDDDGHHDDDDSAFDDKLTPTLVTAGDFLVKGKTRGSRRKGKGTPPPQKSSTGEARGRRLTPPPLPSPSESTSLWEELKAVGIKLPVNYPRSGLEQAMQAHRTLLKELDCLPGVPTLDLSTRSITLKVGRIALHMVIPTFYPAEGITEVTCLEDNTRDGFGVYLASRLQEASRPAGQRLLPRIGAILQRCAEFEKEGCKLQPMPGPGCTVTITLRDGTTLDRALVVRLSQTTHSITVSVENAHQTLHFFNDIATMVSYGIDRWAFESLMESDVFLKDMKKWEFQNYIQPLWKDKWGHSVADVIYIRILVFLPLSSIACFMQTSTRFFSLADNDYLWSDFYRRCFDGTEGGSCRKDALRMASHRRYRFMHRVFRDLKIWTKDKANDRKQWTEDTHEKMADVALGLDLIHIITRGAAVEAAASEGLVWLLSAKANALLRQYHIGAKYCRKVCDMEADLRDQLWVEIRGSGWDTSWGIPSCEEGLKSFTRDLLMKTLDSYEEAERDVILCGLPVGLMDPAKALDICSVEYARLAGRCLL